MNEFDNIPFKDDKLEQTNSLSDLPFENSVPQSNNIIILDDRIKDIPALTKNDSPIITDDNLIIMDDRIKDIPAKNNKVSFKKTSIIIPVIAFALVSVLVMYIFINNSRADTKDLIRIEDNKKVGYVDNDGTIVVKPKYTYGSEYYKGIAIVKNDNDLLGVLNSKGALKEPFGTYYSLSMNNGVYVASKITKDGLKYALLDSKLKELTHFEFDSIKYSKDGYYSFISGETLGILDSEGDEIYTFKVDEVDDKNIEIELSDVDDESVDRYAKVKVNKSSLIVDLSTGKKVFGYTLSDIFVSNNNVFYIKPDLINRNNTYIVVSDGKVKLKSDNYKNIKVEDLDSDIAICINDDDSIDYINLNEQNIINEDKELSYTYGSGLLLVKEGDEYKILSSNKELGSFDNYIPATSIFNNKRLIVETENGKSFVNEKGNLINEKWYEEVEDFNKLGYSKVKENGNYGVIDKNGKTILESKYSYIDFINKKYFTKIKEQLKKELFIIKNEEGFFGLVDNKGNIVIDSKYQGFEFITEEYPFVIGNVDNKKVLIDLTNKKELDIEINTSINITHNSIIVDGNYYNYSGNLLYKAQ